MTVTRTFLILLLTLYNFTTDNDTEVLNVEEMSGDLYN